MLTIIAETENLTVSVASASFILIEVFKSLGIALIVAGLFSFAYDKINFSKEMSKLLENIVVKKDFIENLEPESKKKAISSLLKPSNIELSKYPNISDYYNMYINKTLEIAKRNVRSNYTINAEAYYDESLSAVVVETNYNYRLYPSANGFGKITIGFHEEELSSWCENISIMCPDGTREIHDKPELSKHPENPIAHEFTIKLGSEYSEHRHLDIEIKSFEVGYDHWANHGYQALQPTDGFKYNLKCRDNLEIKDFSVFVIDTKYFLDKKTNRKLSIHCNQWLNEGSGLSVVIGPITKLKRA